MPKSAFEQLKETTDGVRVVSDTKFNQLLQVAESERRERVAEALTNICDTTARVVYGLHKPLIRLVEGLSNKVVFGP